MNSKQQHRGGLHVEEWEKDLPVVPQIQVTRNCNLSCSYCFQNHSGSTISLSTADAILEKVVAHNLRIDPTQNTIQIYWHGGEPLLAGRDFFNGIIRLENQYPELSFENRIQTNGTLMTDDLAQFLVENEFQLGFSLDGPEQLHNKYRRFDKSQKGSFEQAMRGIECYRKYSHQEQIAVIAVVTRSTINKVEEFFTFFKELQAIVQLDIYDLRVSDMGQTAIEQNRDDLLIPTSKEIGEFLIALFDLWFYDQSGSVDFKELRQELKMILQPEINYGRPYDKKRCDFRRLIFSPDGCVYSCDQWISDEKTSLGHIETDPLSIILKNKHQLWTTIKHVLRQSSSTMACGSCEWAHQCGGGCLTCMKYNALLLEARKHGRDDKLWFEETLPGLWHRSSGETYYCDGLCSFRNHVKNVVKQEMMDGRYG